MVQQKNRFKSFVDFIASKRFFYVIVCLFIFQTAWIALSNNYGSPHDEKYHVGLIQVYSQHLTPFMDSQPISYDAFGDVARGTSYLYHYLMSFPYRIISIFSSDIAVQVIFLRLFNIAFVVLGILLLKKILDSLFEKPIVSNLAMFGFVMTPVVVYVSEGVTYDNFVFLGFAASLYLMVKLIKKFNISEALLFLSINTLTVLTKYSYAPIALVLVAGLTACYVVNRRQMIPEIKKSFKIIKRAALILSSLLFLISGGLFLERYGGNIVSYGDPIPDCSEVLNSERCSQWGPWQRNALAKQKNVNKQRIGIVGYTKHWVSTMESTSFGIYKSAITKEALPIIGFVGWLLLVVFLLSLVYFARYITRSPALMILLGAMILYTAALFVVNYRDYRAYGSPIAIQGRYLIPLIPLIMSFVVLFIEKLISQRSKIMPFVVILWVTIFLQGGIITYIVRTDQVWWWHNATVININKSAQNILKPIVFGS